MSNHSLLFNASRWLFSAQPSPHLNYSLSASFSTPLLPCLPETYFPIQSSSMSQNTNPTVNGDNKTSASGSIASVWARGPPSAVSSASASKNQSGANTPSQDGAGLSNLTSASNSTAISIRNAHSRQNSLLVGPGGVDIKKGKFLLAGILRKS